MSNNPVERARRSVWGPTSTRVRKNPWLRGPAIAGYRAVAGALLIGSGPKVFVNTVPKAGSHLLTQLLARIPGLWFSGIHITGREFRADVEMPGDGLGEFDLTAFSRSIKRVRNGQYLTAHIGSSPGVLDLISDQGFRRLLLIRDPRDICVSHAHHVSITPSRPHHDRFARMSSFDERLMASITGLAPLGDDVGLPSIGERLGRYHGWLQDPDTYVIRFEDLVGPSGGGSAGAQRAAVTGLVRHCGHEADASVIERLTAGHRRTPTFRRGVIGDWSKHFNEEHRSAFAEVANSQLEAFGYAGDTG